MNVFFSLNSLFQRIPPIVVIGNTTYVSIFKSGLYFVVVVTQKNVSPIFLLESVNKMSDIIKDYCGKPVTTIN